MSVLEPRVRRIQESEPTLLGAGASLRPLIEPSSASSLRLSQLHVQPQTKFTWSAFAGDRVLLVHQGGGRSSGELTDVELSPGAALFIPAGEEINLRTESDSLDLLVGDALPHCDRHAALGELQRVEYVDAQDVQGATSRRSFQILFGQQNGCTRATLFVGYVPPGEAPWHFHQYDEIVWIWHGGGRFRRRDAEESFTAGCGFRIPRREVHIVANDGPDDLVLVGLFTPAGSPAAAYLADELP